MRVCDLWERADVEESCWAVSCCWGGGAVCSNREEGFSLEVLLGVTSGFATFFFRFLKLNFLGGSKLFLTSDNFSLNRLIVYISVLAQPFYGIPYFFEVRSTSLYVRWSYAGR
jgi:hypothetical protein